MHLTQIYRSTDSEIQSRYPNLQIFHIQTTAYGLHVHIQLNCTRFVASFKKGIHHIYRIKRLIIYGVVGCNIKAFGQLLNKFHRHIRHLTRVQE